jgi:hypothetical protein
VHEPETVRNSTITEEHHDLVERLRILAEVIPEHVGVFKSCLRVTFLSVDEVGEFGGVSKEEYGSIVVDVIPITFLRAELQRESSRVTSGVS